MCRKVRLTFLGPKSKMITHDCEWQDGELVPSAITAAINRSSWLAALKLLNDTEAVDRAKLDDWSPLHAAAQRNFPEIACLLIRLGFDPSRRDFYNYTPLHGAAAGSPGVTAVLLAAGADPNAEDDLVNTPLDRAVDRGDAMSARLLLAYGATPTLPALVDAAEGGKIEMIELLLQAGVDPNQEFDGATPLQYAKKHDRRAAAILLQQSMTH